LTTSALSIWLSLSIKIAAQISMLPEKKRSEAIVMTILLSIWNSSSPDCGYVDYIYARLSRLHAGHQPMDSRI
jgi:hypothetical protein